MCDRLPPSAPVRATRSGDTEHVSDVAYWDARREAELLRDTPRWIAHRGRFLHCGSAETYLKGRWEDRNWRNVPGPFYGAETDTCRAGHTQAPANVLYDELGQEFICRQPRSSDEVRAVLDAAYQDPFDGYAWDGDDHWTPTAVREWWTDRARLVNWIDGRLRDPSERQSKASLIAALLEFRAYVVGPLEADLQSYVTWLEERRRAVSADLG
jgi:hypothetical protein